MAHMYLLDPLGFGIMLPMVSQYKYQHTTLIQGTQGHKYLEVLHLLAILTTPIHPTL